MAATGGVVCVGSIMYDIISYVPRLPKPGESLLGCRVESNFGGKGANPAVAAARLGASAAMIGKVGNDSYGQKMVENLKENKINSDYVFRTEEIASGIAIVIVEQSGENRILVAPGANMLLTKEEVIKATSLIESAKILTCNFETSLEAAKEALRIARKSGVKSILNAAPAILNPDPEFYSLPDIFCVNETEAEIITGLSMEKNDAQTLLAELLTRGCQTVVVTLGEKGALFGSREMSECLLVTSQKVTAKDTTGAGDAFVGALAFFNAYHSALPLQEQIRRSCCVAAYSVQYPGTQTSYPWKKDLVKELFH